MNAQKNNSPNHWLTRLVLVLGKTVDQLLWQHFKKTTGNCQHGFSKGERRLAHLIAFCDKIRGFVARARAADTMYFSKAFNAISQKLRHYGPNGCTT